MNILLGSSSSSSSKCQQGALQLALRHMASRRGSLAADSSSSQWQQALRGVHSTNLQGRRPMLSSSYHQRKRLLTGRHCAGKEGSTATTSSISRPPTCQLLVVLAIPQQHCARQGSRSL